MGAPTVVTKGTTAPVTTAPATSAQPPAPARTEQPVGPLRQFAHDVFVQNSDNPFDRPKGPGLRQIARDTAETTLNAPGDFVHQVRDLFVPDAKPSSSNTEER